MNNSPYINTFVIDQPLVCITTYDNNKSKHIGLSIRYYAGKDIYGCKLFTSGNSKSPWNTLSVIKTVNFSEFAAIVKYEDFDPKGDLIKIIETYKVI